jgi:Tol biopolymer transport system component
MPKQRQFTKLFLVVLAALFAAFATLGVTAPSRANEISPDLRKVLEIRSDNFGGRELFVRHLGDTSGREVKVATLASREVISGHLLGTAAEPVWSPNGQKIAYLANDGLYVVDSNGNNAIRLTKTLTPAVWSSDSTKLAFSKSKADRSDIYSIDVTGENKRNLTGNPSGVESTGPIWAPDDRTIAYTNTDSGGESIWLHNLEAQSSSPLTAPEPDAQIYSKAWSQDGTRLAFSSDGEIGDALSIVDLSNGKVKLLVNMEGRINSPPVWSPNGMMIAYNRSEVDPAVCVFDLNQERSTVLVELDPEDTQQQVEEGESTVPLWSSDSREILATITDPSHRHVFLLGVDGEGVTNLTQNFFYRPICDAVWAPDGTVVVTGYYDPKDDSLFDHRSGEVQMQRLSDPQDDKLQTLLDRSYREAVTAIAAHDRDKVKSIKAELRAINDPVQTWRRVTGSCWRAGRGINPANYRAKTDAVLTELVRAIPDPSAKAGDPRVIAAKIASVGEFYPSWLDYFRIEQTLKSIIDKQRAADQRASTSSDREQG